MKLFLLSGNPDTLAGLRLAGVEGCLVSGEEELKAELSKALSDEDIGIILFTHSLGSRFPELFTPLLHSSSLPLLVEIPDPISPKKAGDLP